MTNTIEILLPPSSNASQIRLGGAFRLPPVPPVKAEATETNQIRLGGAFRLAPVKTEASDAGRVRLGGAFRLAA